MFDTARVVHLLQQSTCSSRQWGKCCAADVERQSRLRYKCICVFMYVAVFMVASACLEVGEEVGWGSVPAPGTVHAAVLLRLRSGWRCR